ncbi:rhomboid family intramembrane serine protease [Oryzifoliimicrobium ureilyticus]|uniref:rhomboid family intramembrane serine protease n=1 Tax=Oryzifoliimicrobium ureilyticus TaxID=3113724 RepID=UPI0030763F84
MNDNVENEAPIQNEVPPARQPIFNAPTSVLLTIVLLAVIYAVQSLLLPEGAVDWLLFNFGLIPLRYATALSQQGPQLYWTPVTYSLLHGSIQHILFNSLWLMIFGAPVVRRIGTLRYLLFWILSSVASAAFHLALNWGENTVLIGASGVISGLMGAACRFAFPPSKVRAHPAHRNPRLSIREVFKSRTAVAFIVFWLAGNLLIALGLPLAGDGDQIVAWDAHIGGFLFGFLLFDLFDVKPRLEDHGSAEDDPLQS